MRLDLRQLTPDRALERWLRLEAQAGAPAAELDARAERSLAEALRALPALGPTVGFARRVMAAIEPAPRRLSRWARLAVSGSLVLAGSAWLGAATWGATWRAGLGGLLRPGEAVDAAGFALRESTMVLVRGLETWRVLSEVRQAMFRVLTTPDAAAVAAGAALVSLLAFHALRGVLAFERSVYRV